MDFVATYREGLYHRLILCSLCCRTDSDRICVSLSLVAIGRKAAAITFLKSTLDLASDPSIKVCILLCLYEITGESRFSQEAKYWNSVTVLDLSLYELFHPLPPVLSPCPSPSDQVRKFSSNGAHIDPLSYSASCLMDEKTAISLIEGTDRGSILLRAVAKCGSVHNLTKALRLQKVRAWFESLQASLVEQTFTQPETFDELFQLLAVTEDLLALVCYYHLSRVSLKVLAYGTRVIENIRFLTEKMNGSSLKGISTQDRETVGLICSQHVKTDSSDEILYSILEQLISPDESREKYNENTTDGCVQSTMFYPSTPLRESALFFACGNIYRIFAWKSAVEVCESTKIERVFLRKDVLEMTRKYAIAVALQPPDNPNIEQSYDSVIWGIIFSGGVDCRVLWFFFIVRNHFVCTSLLSYPEKSSSQPESEPYWLRYTNSLQVLEYFYNLAKNAVSNFERGVGHILPTVLECGSVLRVSSSYMIPEPSSSKPSLNSDTSFIHTMIPPRPSEIDMLVESSFELVELWETAYERKYGAIPRQIFDTFNCKMRS